jgi:hypothetical protein
VVLGIARDLAPTETRHVNLRNFQLNDESQSGRQ